MATPSLEALVKQAAALGSQPSRCGFDLSRNILLSVREARARRPDLVVQFGTYLINHHVARLGHEVWSVYEQVFVALLEHGKQRPGGRGKPKRAVPPGESDSLATAQDYCNILAQQFPKSLRVKRLEAMLSEAKGELELAMADYEEILKEDPNHLGALKRQVALLRSRGRSVEAANKLVEHVEVVCSDTDAWLQLSEIYLAAVRFRRAAFCIEELLLVNPMAHMYHVRYAELLYTMACAPKASADLFHQARKHFAHALELKPAHNLRALYGLLLCCAAAGGTKATKATTVELLAFVQPAIAEEYASCGGSHAALMIKLAQGLMDELAA